MKLGTHFNTPLKAHWSVAFLIFIAASNMFNHLSIFNFSPLTQIIVAISFAMGLLLSIIAHEFGHVLVGRKFGVRFYGITLHALGGAAHMDANIPNARAELLMALAGPAVSVVLAVFLGGLSLLQQHFLPFLPLTLILWSVACLNVILAVFNMLPIYSLDGGRCLRALLWMKFGFRKATEVAVFIGSLGGVAFILMGLLMLVGKHIPFFGVGSDGIWMLIVGAFIIASGQMEKRHYGV